MAHRTVKMEFDDNETLFSTNELEGRKRLRCSNFSSQEKNVLIHIIEKYQEIIESKKTDKASVQEKEKVWGSVTEEFNDILLSEPLRTTKQLKMCYDNLKRKIRREVFTVESPKPKLDHITAIKSQVNVQSDGESNSANDSQTINSNYQISSDQWMLSDSASASSPQTCHSSTQNLDDECKEAPHRKEVTSEEKLRRVLLSKEISLADLDLEMRSKKYELELKVEQAKLEYYRKKIALLDGSLQRNS